MMETQRGYGREAQLVSLAASVVLALWLLIRPEAIGGLALGWRLPVWILGVWALGAGFYHGMGLAAAESGWHRQLLGAPLCWVLMAMLALILSLRTLI